MTNLARRRLAVTFVLAVAMALSLGSVVHLQARACERDAEKLLGQKAVRIGRSMRAPKKLRNVPPKYPELPPGTQGSGMWFGEILIDTSGKVARVWALREVRFVPAFPAFNNAIADAIQQWEFEPLFVNRKATPVCMTVAINVDWQ